MIIYFWRNYRAAELGRAVNLPEQIGWSFGPDKFADDKIIYENIEDCFCGYRVWKRAMCEANPGLNITIEIDGELCL